MVNIQECLTRDRCVFLAASEKNQAIDELITVLCRSVPSLQFHKVKAEVAAREHQLSTRISPQLAIPHAQLEDMAETYIVAGRSRDGIVWEASDKAAPVPLVILVVGDKSRHLEYLSALAGLLEKEDVMRAVLEARNPAGLFSALASPDRREIKARRVHSTTKELLAAALDLADQINASSLLIHLSPDRLPGGSLPSLKKPQCVFVVEETIPSPDEAGFTLLPVPLKGKAIKGVMEISLLVALAHGLVKKHDKIISLFGRTDPERLDSLMVTEISRGFDHILSIPVIGQNGDIRLQVFLTLLEIARDLAREGREGKPVGALFVLGDHGQVTRYCQQMVANPFKGYDESERNIIDPSMVETLKEYSRLDGAIVIRGDGVLVSAGTYLRPDKPGAPLPSGLGARHAAAAAITAVSNALSMAISESTRQISLFHNGERIMVL
jgi:DNA integrity scanning protein DisA with diadenylate cyclase activity/mannitol/fructose-specific phosphotransferase system IIA component (Ntr-type)